MTRARFTLSNEPSAWAVTVSKCPIRARVSSLVKGDWQVHENRLSARACRDSLMSSETCIQMNKLYVICIYHLILIHDLYVSITLEASDTYFEGKQYAPTSLLCFSLPRPRSFCSLSNSRVTFISNTKVRIRFVRPWFISSSVKRVAKATSSSLNKNNRQK